MFDIAITLDPATPMIIEVELYDGRRVACKGHIVCNRKPEIEEAQMIARGTYKAFRDAGSLPIPSGYWGSANLTPTGWYMTGQEEEPWDPRSRYT